MMSLTFDILFIPVYSYLSYLHIAIKNPDFSAEEDAGPKPAFFLFYVTGTRLGYVPKGQYFDLNF